MARSAGRLGVKAQETGRSGSLRSCAGGQPFSRPPGAENHFRAVMAASAPAPRPRDPAYMPLPTRRERAARRPLPSAENRSVPATPSAGTHYRRLDAGFSRVSAHQQLGAHGLVEPRGPVCAAIWRQSSPVRARRTAIHRFSAIFHACARTRRHEPIVGRQRTMRGAGPAAAPPPRARERGLDVRNPRSGASARCARPRRRLRHRDNLDVRRGQKPAQSVDAGASSSVKRGSSDLLHGRLRTADPGAHAIDTERSAAPRRRDRP